MMMEQPHTARGGEKDGEVGVTQMVTNQPFSEMNSNNDHSGVSEDLPWTCGKAFIPSMH